MQCWTEKNLRRSGKIFNLICAFSETFFVRFVSRYQSDIERNILLRVGRLDVYDVVTRHFENFELHAEEMRSPEMDFSDILAQNWSATQARSGILLLARWTRIILFLFPDLELPRQSFQRANKKYVFCSVWDLLLRFRPSVWSQPNIELLTADHGTEVHGNTNDWESVTGNDIKVYSLVS